MPRRPVLIAMLFVCLCVAGSGAAVGDASAQAMSPASPPAGSAASAQSALDPTAPASSPAAEPAPVAPATAPPAPARGPRPVLDPQADRGRNDVLGRLLPKAPKIAGTDKSFPKADLAAPLTECPTARPTACSLDYVPVCAAVGPRADGGAGPVPRKTFGSACKACRAPNVTGYATGECPAP